ncbi:MAG TPA: histidine--tRNA ligase [Candidatus Eisenbacteria bacterium]|nr:histidine--tRNA ligase [Candidatus Eisenbacteria bacterium]
MKNAQNSDTITDMQVQTLKGFRDFLPKEARKRKYMMDTFKKVFESYGFEGMETPVLEFDEILTGKYGDEGDKLMYRFEDNGGRKVAMRYDQTVPLARFVAQYNNLLPTPFKRYQIQNVFRAENTQKGRYREFIQCDIDTVGIDSANADAEIIATAASALKALGFTKFKVLINDRSVFEGLSMDAIIVLDKLKKIGEDGVVEEMVVKGICTNAEEAKNLLQSIIDTKPTERLQEIFEALEKMGLSKENFEFSPTLARGLDYYTGMIFEIEAEEYPVGSICGGGRYDKLIGMFAGRDIPAVGFAFGFDRTYEAMDALNLFPEEMTNATSKVLVSVFNKKLEKKSIEVSSQLRSNNINAEVYLSETKMEKQLKYADQKGIPYVIILGPEEVEKNVVTLKNLKDRTQQQLPLEDVIKKLA